jgi:TolB protein
MRFPALLGALIAFAVGGVSPATTSSDAVFLPGLVSTPAAEVRLAFSPHGRWLAWGAIGRSGGPDQQDVWISRRDGDHWATPSQAAFDTEAVEFDPAFTPDGRRLYFHSDRAGGQGGTDIWYADFDTATGALSAPVNAGPSINSRGEEWAPTPTPDGGLLFASDGWGGEGRHDLFETRPGAARPLNLGPAVNGADEDFDAALYEGRVLIFSSGRMDDDEAKVRLNISRKHAGRWSARRPLAAGCSSFVIGASLRPGDPDHLYYAANCPGGLGRMDMHETSIGPLLRG